MAETHYRFRRLRAACTVFFISIAMVNGPTPPGTGVIAEATAATLEKLTSPVRTDSLFSAWFFWYCATNEGLLPGCLSTSLLQSC
jgi:hypothetical protein